MRANLAQTPGPNLFLRHLPPTMLENELEAMLSPHGRLKRLTVWKDHQTRLSKGFGMAEFETTEGAVSALKNLQGRELADGGAPLEIEFHHGKRRTDGAPDVGAPCTNMYIRGLPLNMTEEQLRDVLRNYGEIKRLTIWKDQFGRSKGFGMCEYGSAEQARLALERLRGQTLDNQTPLHVEVNPPKPPQQHQPNQMGGGGGYMGQPGVQGQGLSQTPIPNLYIGGFPLSYDENDLQDLVQPYGQVKRVTVWRDKVTNASKGFGLVEFSDPSQATSVLNALNGVTVDGHNTPLKVEYNYPKKKFPAAGGNTDILADAGQTQCSNIFLKCLPLHVGDAELHALLSQYGRITRSTVWKDQQTQQSRGFGFCEFSSPASANAAIQALNGAILAGTMTPIHVELHTKQGHQPPTHQTQHQQQQQQVQQQHQQQQQQQQQQVQQQVQQHQQQVQQQLLANTQQQQQQAQQQKAINPFGGALPRYDQEQLKGMLEPNSMLRYTVFKDRTGVQDTKNFGMPDFNSISSAAGLGQLPSHSALGLDYHQAAGMGQQHSMHPVHAHRPTFP